MPTLINPKWERFAQARAAGETASRAYVTAGFKPNDSHASRLDGNGKVRERIAELQEAAARRMVEIISHDAKAQMDMLVLDIIAAREAGNFNAVMKGHET